MRVCQKLIEVVKLFPMLSAENSGITRGGKGWGGGHMPEYNFFLGGGTELM